MSPAGLTTAVRRRDTKAIIDIVGEIDGFSDRELASAYALAASTGPSLIVLNFAGVEYINSTGIAVIVAVLSRAREDHIPLGICCLSDHYHEIFRITRLADFMKVYPDEETIWLNVD